MPNKNLKDHIQKTFKKLLKSYSIDEIDVQLICDTMKIKRQSFYYHFGSIYDVVLAIYDYSILNIEENVSISELIKKAINIVFSDEEMNREIAVSTCEEILFDYMYAFFNTGVQKLFSEYSIDERKEISRIISNSLASELLYLFKNNEYSENDIYEKMSVYFNEKYIFYFKNSRSNI